MRWKLRQPPRSDMAALNEPAVELEAPGAVVVVSASHPLSTSSPRNHPAQSHKHRGPSTDAALTE
jgi:hypothetical protein